MTQRVLAVDPGSVNVGLAAFEDGEFLEARTIRGRGDDWAARMGRIAVELAEHVTGAWRPDVVAIEGVVLHSGARANPKTLALMGATRGYLIRVFAELAPGARILEIAPASVRSVVGAPRSRAGAKRFNAIATSALFGEDLGSEDARDAAVIGLAALRALQLEALGVREVRPPRRPRALRPIAAATPQLTLGAHG